MRDDTQLKQAIAAIKAGDKPGARQILEQLLATDPRNVEAWRWLSQAQDDNAKRIEYLEHVLDLVPYDYGAAKALGILPIDIGSGGSAFVAGLLAFLSGVVAFFFVSQATLGVAILAGACLLGILGRLAQADHHQKNLLRMMSRIRPDK